MRQAQRSSPSQSSIPTLDNPTTSNPLTSASIHKKHTDCSATITWRVVQADETYEPERQTPDNVSPMARCLTRSRPQQGIQRRRALSEHPRVLVLQDYWDDIHGSQAREAHVREGLLTCTNSHDLNGGDEDHSLSQIMTETKRYDELEPQLDLTSASRISIDSRTSESQKTRIPKIVKPREVDLDSGTIHDNIAATPFMTNVISKLPPPPVDAQPGSIHAPWLRLTEYELALLRKRMKKGSVWSPSATVFHRELTDRGRGIAAYRAARIASSEYGIDEANVTSDMAIRKKRPRECYSDDNDEDEEEFSRAFNPRKGKRRMTISDSESDSGLALCDKVVNQSKRCKDSEEVLSIPIPPPVSSAYALPISAISTDDDDEELSKPFRRRKLRMTILDSDSDSGAAPRIEAVDHMNRSEDHEEVMPDPPPIPSSQSASVSINSSVVLFIPACIIEPFPLPAPHQSSQHGTRFDETTLDKAITTQQLKQGPAILFDRAHELRLRARGGRKARYGVLLTPENLIERASRGWNRFWNADNNVIED